MSSSERKHYLLSAIRTAFRTTHVTPQPNSGLPEQLHQLRFRHEIAVEERPHVLPQQKIDMERPSHQPSGARLTEQMTQLRELVHHSVRLFVVQPGDLKCRKLRVRPDTQGELLQLLAPFATAD